MRISPVINVDRLKRYRDRAEQVGEAEVEIIVRRRTFRGRVQYLVRWSGADSSLDEWRYAADLPNCQELIAAFEARCDPAAPGGGRPRRAHKGGPAAGPEPPLIPSPRSTPFSTPSPSEVDRADAFLRQWRLWGRPPR